MDKNNYTRLAIHLYVSLAARYEAAVKAELGDEYPADAEIPLSAWFADNPKDTALFGSAMRRRIGFTLYPNHTLPAIRRMAAISDGALIDVLYWGMKNLGGSMRGAYNVLFSIAGDYIRSAPANTIFDMVNAAISDCPDGQSALATGYKLARKDNHAYPVVPQLADILVRLAGAGVSPTTLEVNCNTADILAVARRAGGKNVGRLFGLTSHDHLLPTALATAHGLLPREFEIFSGDYLANSGVVPNYWRTEKFSSIVGVLDAGVNWSPDKAIGDARYPIIPHRTEGVAAQLLNAISLLAPNGTMAVVVDVGLLYRNAAAPVREHIVRSGMLRGVVLLPHAILNGTGVQTAILVLANRPNNDGVTFVDASSLFARKRRNNELLPEAAGLILSAYREHGDINTVVANGARFVARSISLCEIEANNFNLGVDNYVN
ncbi:MAG: hypothetical protein D6712_08780 [Chloroflexi bacterium]|nr:MAG: hypothetical protein D6712_08780 [Chloroflexota bacterium]